MSDCNVIRFRPARGREVINADIQRQLDDIRSRTAWQVRVLSDFGTHAYCEVFDACEPTSSAGHCMWLIATAERSRLSLDALAP